LLTAKGDVVHFLVWATAVHAATARNTVACVPTRGREREGEQGQLRMFPCELADLDEEYVRPYYSAMTRY
jgi:hypothetical protein